MLRHSLFIVLFIFCSYSYGQKNDTSAKNISIIPGVQIQPLLLNNGILTPITFKVQMRIKDYVLWPDMRFGFSSQNLELSTAHQYSYNFNGAYIQPGVLFYAQNPLINTRSLYVGFHAYFGWFTHAVNMKVTDVNWGTSQEFTAAFKSNLFGGTLELGNIFSLSKKLKMTASLNLAVTQQQPIESVRLPSRIAAVGFYSNSGIGFGGAIGMHYQVY